MTDTYIISDPDDTRFGPCIGVVSNMLTGRQVASYAGGQHVVLNEKLCCGCDAPLADGPCGCEIEGE
jgi:hypothetical protein